LEGDNTYLQEEQSYKNNEALLYADLKSKKRKAFEYLYDNYTSGGDFSAMKQVQNATAFAITLEPRGGSPSPTMDQMYVMGSI
jgi:hypothetical protein